MERIEVTVLHSSGWTDRIERQWMDEEIRPLVSDLTNGIDQRKEEEGHRVSNTGEVALFYGRDGLTHASVFVSPHHEEEGYTFLDFLLEAETE